MLPDRQVEQRTGIGCCGITAQSGKGGFVAGKLHVLRRVFERQPDQRIEPVNAGDRQRYQTNQMVAAADMNQLMDDHTLQLFFREHTIGEDNPGAQIADDHRTFRTGRGIQRNTAAQWMAEQTVASVKELLVMVQTGGFIFLQQDQIGAGAAHQQQQYTAYPDTGPGDGQQLFIQPVLGIVRNGQRGHDIRIGFSFCRDRFRRGGFRRFLRNRRRCFFIRSGGCLRHQFNRWERRCGRDGLCQIFIDGILRGIIGRGEDTDRTGQRYRQNQPQQDQTPHRIAEPPWQFFTGQQPHSQYDDDDNTGGQAGFGHKKEAGNQRVHLITPSFISAWSDGRSVLSVLQLPRR